MQESKSQHTLLAKVLACLAAWYPGVIMAGKLPFPCDCSYSSVYFNLKNKNTKIIIIIQKKFVIPLEVILQCQTLSELTSLMVCSAWDIVTIFWFVTEPEYHACCWENSDWDWKACLDKTDKTHCLLTFTTCSLLQNNLLHQLAEILPDFDGVPDRNEKMKLWQQS